MAPRSIASREPTETRPSSFKIWAAGNLQKKGGIQAREHLGIFPEALRPRNGYRSPRELHGARRWTMTVMGKSPEQPPEVAQLAFRTQTLQSSDTHRQVGSLRPSVSDRRYGLRRGTSSYTSPHRVPQVGDAACADQVDTRTTTLSYELGKVRGTGMFPRLARCLAETAVAARRTRIPSGPITTTR
jgi:hypothetical protein